MNAFDILAHGPVDGLPVPDIRYIDDKFYKMMHVAPGFFEKLADVLHHLVGLLDRVVALDVFRRVQILRTLAAQPDRAAAACDHRLGQIVVQLLLRIGILRVEFPQPFMRHAGLLEER